MSKGILSDQRSFTVVGAEIPPAGDGILVTVSDPFVVASFASLQSSLSISVSNFLGEYQPALVGTPTQPTPDTLWIPTVYHFPSTAMGLLDVKLTIASNAQPSGWKNVRSGYDVTVTNSSTFSDWTPLLERGITDWGVHLTVPNGVLTAGWSGLLGIRSFTSTLQPTKDATGVLFQGSAFLRDTLTLPAATGNNFSISIEQVNSTAFPKTAVGMNVATALQDRNLNLTGIMGTPVGGGGNGSFDIRLKSGAIQNLLGTPGSYMSLTTDVSNDGQYSIDATTATFTKGVSGTVGTLQLIGHATLCDSHVRFWKINTAQKMDSTTETNWKAYIANVVANGLSVV